MDNLKKEIDNTIEKARNEVKSGLKKAKINARKEVEAEFEKDILAIKEKYGREINKVYELFESVK